MSTITNVQRITAATVGQHEHLQQGMNAGLEYIFRCVIGAKRFLFPIIEKIVCAQAFYPQFLPTKHRRELALASTPN